MQSEVLHSSVAQEVFVGLWNLLSRAEPARAECGDVERYIQVLGDTFAIPVVSDATSPQFVSIMHPRNACISANAACWMFSGATRRLQLLLRSQRLFVATVKLLVLDINYHQHQAPLLIYSEMA